MSSTPTANEILGRLSLPTPPWRRLPGGAYLHATKGYRAGGSQAQHRHAGPVGYKYEGGIRRKINRFNPSYAERALINSREKINATA